MRDFVSVLRADWNEGIVKRWRRYLIVVFVAVITCYNYLDNAYTSFAYKGIEAYPSWLMCLLRVLRGMKEFAPEDDKIFELPVEFLILNLMLAYMIGDYMVKDFKGFGLQLMLQSRKKYVWWISKCVWCVFTVGLFYVSIVSGVTIAWAIKGFKGGFVDLQLEALRYTLGSYGSEIILADVGFLLLAIVLVSVAVSMFQMVSTLFIKPIASFCVVAVIYVISGYYMSDWLLGNYLMLYRSNLVVDGGVNAAMGLCIALVMIVVACYGGYMWFRKRDMM